MRIVQLTPGTGSFYCGTCLRDNALVVELRRQGHDALMAPLYLPPTLDEAPATPDAPVLFGGVNAYLQQKSALFRRTPRWVDRLLDSGPVLRLAAARAGMTRASELGEMTLSTLRGEEGRQRKEVERLSEWLAGERPEVVCLSNALMVGMARRIREVTGAAVACTLHGEDSFLDDLPEPYRRQCWETLSERARDTDAFLAVSRYYAGVMAARAKLPPERVHVVYNGILLDGYEPAQRTPAPPVVGYLARMCRTKGLETLVEAYVRLRQRGRVPGVRLRVAGTRTPADRSYVERLTKRLSEAGLASEAEFLPNISREEKLAFLRSLSVLSVPATYGESFGLYVVEALAAGVPVVQPDHAAFPELIEQTGGGLLCKPDDPEALALALEELLADPDRALALGKRGRRNVLEKFSVERMGRECLGIFQAIARTRQALVAGAAGEPGSAPTRS